MSMPPPPGQPLNGQPAPQGQPYAGQPAPQGQPYVGQPYGGQPYAGQPYAGQPYAQQMPAPVQEYKDASRNGQQFAIRLRKHTGMIIVGQTRTAITRGSFQQCQEAYTAAQTHNLIFGWWGIISLLVYNWMAILSNHKAKTHLESLAASYQ